MLLLQPERGVGGGGDEGGSDTKVKRKRKQNQNQTTDRLKARTRHRRREKKTNVPQTKRNEMLKRLAPIKLSKHFTGFYVRRKF